MNGTTLDIDTIRYPGEKGAFGVLLVASFLTLAVPVLLLVAVPEAVQMVVVFFYVLLYLLVSWLGKMLAMASIRGHGICVTEKQ